MKNKPYVVPKVYSNTIGNTQNETNKEKQSKQGHEYMVPTGRHTTEGDIPRSKPPVSLPLAEQKVPILNGNAPKKGGNLKPSAQYLTYEMKKSHEAKLMVTEETTTNKAAQATTNKTSSSQKFSREKNKEVPKQGNDPRRKPTRDLFWQKPDEHTVPTAATSTINGRMTEFKARYKNSAVPEEQPTGISTWMTDLLSFGVTGDDNLPRRTAYAKQNMLRFASNNDEPETFTRFIIIGVLWLTCMIICFYTTHFKESINRWRHAKDNFDWETTSICFYSVSMLENPKYVS